MPDDFAKMQTPLVEALRRMGLKLPLISRIVVGLIVTITLAAQISMLFVPGLVGLKDGGIYLATAKSLAEGQGYRIQSLPEPLPQTKYPPLFPFLVSVIWQLAPRFPDNLPLLRLVSLFSTWGWALLVWWLVAREMGRRELALWIAEAGNRATLGSSPLYS